MPGSFEARFLVKIPEKPWTRTGSMHTPVVPVPTGSAAEFERVTAMMYERLSLTSPTNQRQLARALLMLPLT